MDYPDLIGPLLQEQLRRNDEAIETMVEKMLVTPGEFGVLVEPQVDGSVRVSLSRSVEPMAVSWLPRVDESGVMPDLTAP